GGSEAVAVEQWKWSNGGRAVMVVMN
nr:hypothetical protein [Tanacetum cinerariifolium]